MVLKKPLRKTQKIAPPIGSRRPVKGSVRMTRLGEGLPNIPLMQLELQGYWDVLLGRVPSPVNKGVHSLHEVADAYYARASEMTALIQQMEASGQILKSSHHYKFRTGELRTFMEMAKRAADLGSRRLTYEAIRIESERNGRTLGVLEDD